MESPAAVSGPQSHPLPRLGEPIGGTDRLGLVAVLAVGVYVACLSWFKLASVDLGYHLAYGAHFLDHGRIVDVDPFLYPANAEFFVNANWGAQVVFALVDRAAGAAGLIALRVGLIALTFGLIAAVVRRWTGRWGPVAWAWLLAGTAAYERFSLRPELFSYAILMTMVWLHVRGVRSWRGVATLAVLQVAWVNLHSYFLVGLMVSGCWYAAAGIRLLRGGAGAAAERQGALNSIGRLSAALVIHIAVCCINPWHVRGAYFPIEAMSYLRSAEVLASGPNSSADASPWAAISEFHSPFAHMWPAWLRASSRTLSAYLVLLAVAAAGVVAALVKRRWAELLLLLILFAMSLQLRRNIAQFALAGAPLAIVLLSGATAGAATTGRLRRLAAGGLSVGALALALLWIVGLVNGRFYFVERRLSRQFGTGYGDRVFITDAARWVAGQSALTPELFVNYNASSNVLPMLAGRFKVFVDTNTFAYKPETLGLAQRLGQAKGEVDRTLNKFQINALLLQCGGDADDLVRWLATRYTEWALVYFDRHAVVFVRRIPAHVPLIAAHRITPNLLDPARWIADIQGPDAYRAGELSASAKTPLALGWFEQARPLLDEAVRLAPDYDDAWVNLGQCYGMRANRARVEGRSPQSAAEDLTEAIRCFTTARRLNPASQEAEVNLQRAIQSRDSLYGRRGETAGKQ